MENIKNLVKRLFNEVIRRKILLIIVVAILSIGVVTLLFNDSSKKSTPIVKTKYTVLFNSNSETEVESQVLDEGTRLKEPQNPIKDGYIFIGWYQGDELYNFNNKINESIELEAKWEELKSDEVIVIFNTGKGTVIKNQLLKKGLKVEKPANPKLVNNEFIGWYLNNKKYDFDDPVNEDITLLAKWKEIVTTTSQNRVTTSTNKSGNTTTTTTTKKTTIASNLSKPETVTGLTIEYTVNGDVYIRFSLAPEASGYEIYRSKLHDSNYSLISTISLNYNFSSPDNLDTSSEYYYKVRAYKSSDGEKIYGNYSSIVHVPERVSAPSNIYFRLRYNNNNGLGQETVTYSSSGADSYILYNGDAQQEPTTSTSQTFGWYTQGASYRVVAKKSGSGYVMYSYPNKVYEIPSIGKISGYSVSTTRTATPIPNGTSYSYNSIYNWNPISNIEGLRIYEVVTSGCLIDNPYSYIELDKTSTSYSRASSSGYSVLKAYKETSYYLMESYYCTNASTNY